MADRSLEPGVPFAELPGLLLLYYFHYIFYFAIKYYTKHFNGMGGNIHIFLHAVNLSGTDLIVFYEPVCGHISGFHGFPKLLISYHCLDPPVLYLQENLIV